MFVHGNSPDSTKPFSFPGPIYHGGHRSPLASIQLFPGNVPHHRSGGILYWRHRHHVDATGRYLSDRDGRAVETWLGEGAGVLHRVGIRRKDWEPVNNSEKSVGVKFKTRKSSLGSNSVRRDMDFVQSKDEALFCLNFKRTLLIIKKSRLRFMEKKLQRSIRLVKTSLMSDRWSANFTHLFAWIFPAKDFYKIRSSSDIKVIYM